MKVAGCRCTVPASSSMISACWLKLTVLGATSPSCALSQCNALQHYKAGTPPALLAWPAVDGLTMWQTATEYCQSISALASHKATCTLDLRVHVQVPRHPCPSTPQLHQSHSLPPERPQVRGSCFINVMLCNLALAARGPAECLPVLPGRGSNRMQHKQSCWRLPAKRHVSRGSTRRRQPRCGSMWSFLLEAAPGRKLQVSQEQQRPQDDVLASCSGHAWDRHASYERLSAYV